MPGKNKIYAQWDMAIERRTGEKLTIIRILEPYDDEDDMGQKVLVRGDGHVKKQIFGGELRPLEDSTKATYLCSKCRVAAEDDRF